MPKVNFFMWMVMHKKELTGENMVKSGFYGPFRCCLCQQAVETKNHLFIDCDFTQQPWVLILNGLSVSVPVQTEIVFLF